MSPKVFVLIGMTAGSFIGGYLPTLLGADILSFGGVIGSLIGGLSGIFIGYKVSSWMA